MYQFIWACNQCLLIGGFAMITRNSNLLRTTVIVISLDQILWFIDIGGYLIFRKFYVGVAKYIIWEETSKMRLLTTFHHIFYIPLVLWLTSPSVSYCSFSWKMYALSCVISICLAFVARNNCSKCLTVMIKNNEYKDKRKF